MGKRLGAEEKRRSGAEAEVFFAEKRAFSAKVGFGLAFFLKEVIFSDS